jgi:2-polyprenyl-3-methyl-5-hydroxy-6-metoxy-1,4-benzoquinol methylase
MTESKAWDWEKESGTIWLEPCEESYFYSNKWKRAGKRTLLDLGCGLGRHSILFAREGFEVTAADLSAAALEHVRKWQAEEGLQIHTVCCDMKELPFDDGAFDCVWAFHVISHADTPGIIRIFSEINRVLRPDGEMYITVCSKASKSFCEAGYPIIDENTVLKTQDGPEKNVPHFYAGLEDLSRLLKDFDILGIRHIDDCFFNGTYQDGKHYFIHAKKKAL